jgi:hypothetical protein
VHFEARPEPPGVVGRSEIVDTLFEINYADLLGVVIIAEAAGVVGATLKREAGPALEGQPADGTAPDNEGLSFRLERSSERSLCVITGVACRRELASFSSVLGSFGPNPLPVGHFHAALFPYQSLPWDEIDLFTVVNACFGSEPAAGLLHLQADVRNPDDFAETELLRGACWIGKIKEIAVPRPND